MKEAQQGCPVCRASLSPTARYCGGCGHAIAPTATNYSNSDDAGGPSLVGQEVAGRYRIIGKLGEGGMGAVYRAEQMSLKREIALKVLKPELSSRPGLVRRFNAEAELAAKLNHPNTVTLYDFGQDQDGSLYIAMEFIAGRSLRDLLVKEGPQPMPRIAAIGSQICASLADAHATGIVHRDLKPDNVMLSERGKKTDVVTVLDFGIAKLRDEEGNITQQPMTRAGDMLGTPQYMAPEQIRGERVDARTDIYAIGIILYEMATARLPFDAKSIMALLSMHLTEAPIPPHQRRPDLQIDAGLERLIMHCLSKDSNQRPASMDAVEEALTALAPMSAQAFAGQPVSVQPGTGQPFSGQPGTGQPFSGQPGTGQPLSGHAATGHPTGAAPPNTALPHASTPGGIGGNRPIAASASATPVRQHTPLPAAPAKGKSSAWLWISLAVILLGGGGASLYFIFTPASIAHEEPDAGVGDDFYSKWAGSSQSNDSDNDEDYSAELADLEKLFEEEHAALDEDDDMLVRPGEFQYAGAQSYSDPTFEYVVDLPATFELQEAGAGAAIFKGFVNGHTTVIFTAAWLQAIGLSDEEVKSDFEKFAKSNELQLKSVRWDSRRRTIRGRLRTLDNNSEGDYIVFSKPPRVFFAAIGSRPKNYSKDKKYRNTFLEAHFHPTADQ